MNERVNIFVLSRNRVLSDHSGCAQYYKYIAKVIVGRMNRPQEPLVLMGLL